MSTPAWIGSLSAGVVKTDLLKDAATGAFTYADALQVLRDVQSAGSVTAAEFAALQTVAANLDAGLKASAYVDSIFTQLVDGSAANATWVGGAAGSSRPLGDLEAGTTAGKLGELIGQWFLGTNLPDPTVSGSTGSPYPYAALTGPLYGATGAASVDDICQGADGDCELIAGLVVMAQNHPSQLASMIVANPDGTWGVRFYVGGDEVWETVNDEAPVYSGTTNPLYAHNPNEANTALWVGLVEKAYAQLSATGLIGHPATDSYANINADPPTDVLPNLSDAGQVNYFFASSTTFDADKAWYIDAVDSGDDVILESWGATYDSSGRDQLVDDHAFAVVGYDSATGDFIVRNPWGDAYAGQGWDTQFEVSLADVAKVKGDLVIDDAGADNSNVRLVSEAGQILAGAGASISGFFAASDVTGARVTSYSLQLLGGAAIQLNGAANLATAAQTSRGQIVVSASDLSKLTITAAAGAGQQTLLVSAYDGKAWSATANIALTVSPSSEAINPNVGNLVAPGASVQLSSLFTLIGPAPAWYEFIVPAGEGSIDLNGAQDYASGDTYEIAADQLSLLTYVAPLAGGAATLEATAYSGSAWTDFQQIQVDVGVSVAAALQDYASGQLAQGADIADSAANIFANLGALQSAFQAGELASIRASDATPQHETLRQAEYEADLGLISILQGDVAITVEQLVSSGATATSVALAAGQEQVVEKGGDAVSARVSSGGKQLVESGGAANASLVSGGGVLEILAGGAVAGAILRGGQELDYGAAGADAVSSGGALIVEHGGLDSAAKVTNGGTVTVASGGSTSGDMLSSGGVEVVGAGATAASLQVLRGGTAYVDGSGTTTGAVVSAGGRETISAGGAALDLTVFSGGALLDDGQVRIDGGATLAGALSGSGAVVQSGPGDLVLGGPGAAFGGRAVIEGGAIELAAAAALGGGYVRFSAPATGSAVLRIDAADAPKAGGTFANVISNFDAAREAIDLAGVVFVASASATATGSTLVLSDGGKTYGFNIAGGAAGGYSVLSDGQGGTLIEAKSLALAQTAAAFSPSIGGDVRNAVGGEPGWQAPSLLAHASLLGPAPEA